MSFNLPAQGTIALIIVTALITAVIAVFGRRFAETLLDWTLRPLKWVAESVYRWIAPRNPLSISLRSYKKHVQRSWLTKIENPIGPELDVPLEHAFAPLKLISSSSQETIDLFTHLSAHARCVVLGGPGTGKTTLMKSLVTRIINGRANETLNSLIPAFVVLRKLGVKQQTVKEAITSAFADFHFPGAERFVDSALRQGRMLIVLDGLDEVGVNREFVVGEIISFCESDDQLANRNHVIVTCREYSYRTEDLRSVIKNIVRVEPFANHHMRVFLQGWPTYQGRSALALYGLIQRDSQIRDICRNPLLLTILTGLYLENRNFEFPTSRSLFYKAAIEELITKRPARREIKQKFEPADKWNVLQRVSLSRLETVQVNEDPEELTTDTFREQATAVFRGQIDFSEFIKELVELNGIIKPTSDGIYTCAHRTIQEYFAANEAGRIRTPDDVVLRFSDRQDLIEVLYFYCGMLKNIPQLTNIVEFFASDRRWLEASRCLLSMTEVPVASQVYRVTTELKAQIVSGTEFRPVLEILSSLAQRPEVEFDPARERFFEAVNYLAGGNQATGASALESALATSPDVAMKVIPGLLKHHSERWQAAAVQLLKDIGTDEALDKLVQLLASDNEFTRRAAARVLSGLIRTRNKDLKDRAALLPDRKDRGIWPLDQLFPANLAIPIAASLVDVIAVENTAIGLASKAIRLTGSEDKFAGTFLRNWRNVPRDLRRSVYWRKTAALMGWVGFILPLFMWSLVVGMELWCYGNDKVLRLQINPIECQAIERRLTREVELRAGDIVTELEQHYPPNASGISRILPSNWEVEPVIPGNVEATFNRLKKYKTGLFDPYDSARDEETLGIIAVHASYEKFLPFDAASKELARNLPLLNSNRYLILHARGSGLVISMIIAFLFLVIRRLAKKENTLFATSSLVTVSFALKLWPGFMLIMVIVLQGVNMTSVWVACAALIVLCIVARATMVRVRWPRNPLLEAVNDLIPLTDLRNNDNMAKPTKRPRSVISVEADRTSL